VFLEGSVADVKQKFKENKYRIEFEGDRIPSFDSYNVTDKTKNSVTIKLPQEIDGNELLKYAVQQGTHITSFNEILPSLNDIFIKQVRI